MFTHPPCLTHTHTLDDSILMQRFIKYDPVCNYSIKINIILWQTNVRLLKGVLCSIDLRSITHHGILCLPPILLCCWFEPTCTTHTHTHTHTHTPPHTHTHTLLLHTLCDHMNLSPAQKRSVNKMHEFKVCVCVCVCVFLAVFQQLIYIYSSECK